MQAQGDLVMASEGGVASRMTSGSGSLSAAAPQWLCAGGSITDPTGRTIKGGHAVPAVCQQ